MTDRSRRRLALAGAAVLLGVAIVAVYPLRLAPEWPHDDAVLHLAAGMVIALAGGAVTDRAGDAIAVAAVVLALGWEIAEAWWFKCLNPAPRPCPAELLHWFTWHDTHADVLLAIVGAWWTLIAIGRYR